ncbi:MAG: flagellar basal body L-ring protein FlgH [Litoricola sp.]|nr:flagellar basal body L-ring protein FlgH [Litorivicinus sp.]|tara:strand:- start:6890 stop:7561 length:672 start_codon:yes stop_codon:yes gene_type:complete
MQHFLMTFGVLMIAGCAGPQKVAGPSPEFAPIIPVANQQSAIPTGSVYNVAFSDSWFGEKKAYRVGDIVTVVLDESVDADTTTKNTASRKTKTDVLSPLQLAKWGSPGGFLSSDLQEENEVSSTGSGVIDQSATLKGTMTAQIVEVYPNGNLLIRGEKIVNFSSGSEVVQVKGIIRPEDIQPDNTVQSKRLASAQITYKGVGPNANVQKIPWGTNLLLSIWPF